MLSVSENEAMIELSELSGESASSDDEKGKALESSTLKKASCTSSSSYLRVGTNCTSSSYSRVGTNCTRSSYSRVGTNTAVASINRMYNADRNQKAVQLHAVARKSR